MEVRVAKIDLEAALKVVSSTCASINGDVMSHYVFRCNSGHSEMLSTNGRVFSSSPVILSASEDGNFTLEAKRLHQMISSISGNCLFEITVNGSDVSIKADSGKNSFTSMDPSTFPFWDANLSVAKETASVKASRLHAAYSYASQFVSDDVDASPQFCVAEFKNGSLFATDTGAVSLVKVAGMENSKVRIFKKDIKPLLSFLSTAKEEDITVLEHEQAFFFRRMDGAVFGESVFRYSFPDDTKVNMDSKDDVVVDFFKEEVESGIKFLASGAKWEDIKVVVKVVDGCITLSMKSASDKEISTKVIPQTVVINADTIPDSGIPLNHKYLSLLISNWDGSKVSMGFSKFKKGGWARIREERDGDIFMSMTPWLKTA